MIGKKSGKFVMAAYSLDEIYRQNAPSRPFWPYQSWSDVQFSQSHGEQRTAGDELDENETGSDVELLEEPDHWLEDLDDEVSESCPIQCLLDIVNSPNVSCTPEAKNIQSDILHVLEKTLTALSAAHKLLRGSYLLPVGSMAENSKINKADEFDFAIILPALAEKDVIFNLLLRKDSILTDGFMSDLVVDFCHEDKNEVILNFGKYLKQKWSEEMSKHMTPNLEIQHTSCYSDDVSVAGTFHLKRKNDKSIIDLDVCFWVPLDSEILSSAPDEVEQKDFLLQNCLDEHGLVYAILPRDEGIETSMNSIRFATSSLEKSKLLQWGTDNNRLKCYRLCKCIVSRLVPKFQKRQECCFCYESLISSFCLKNIVLYLINAYKSDKFWTEDQLPNRIVEVFAVLSMCMKINFHRVSAFFVPYEIQINRTLKFDMEKKCVLRDSLPDETKVCILPNIDEITCKMSDEISKQVLEDYKEFLAGNEWRSAEVICRLSELLSVLRTEDKNEREELRRNPGWNCYGLC